MWKQAVRFLIKLLWLMIDVLDALIYTRIVKSIFKLVLFGLI